MLLLLFNKFRNIRGIEKNTRLNVCCVNNDGSSQAHNGLAQNDSHFYLLKVGFIQVFLFCTIYSDDSVIRNASI